MLWATEWAHLPGYAFAWTPPDQYSVGSDSDSPYMALPYVPPVVPYTSPVLLAWSRSYPIDVLHILVLSLKPGMGERMGGMNDLKVYEGV